MKSIRDAKSCQSKSARETFPAALLLPHSWGKIYISVGWRVLRVGWIMFLHVCQIESELKMGAEKLLKASSQSMEN